MSWAPGPRPDWVTNVLAGAGGPVYESGRRPFEPDDLLGEAGFRAGTTEAPGASVHEPLAVLCGSLEHEAGLHLVGRWRAREVIVRHLENRLRLEAALHDDPGIEAETITGPIIVTGSPRAGTSIMHQLLALPPWARAPMAWEYWAPAPPPLAATHETDPRIPLADRDVRLSAALAPMFDGMHEQGARIPREDASAMGIDLRSDVLGTHYGVPSYRAWLAATDMASAYAWHRRILQTLQRHVPTVRWVVKWPGHVNHLPTLLATYPDARIVVCHRDPLAMLSSVTSLTATLRWAHAESVDLAEVAREQADTFAAQCDRLTRWDLDGVIDPTRVVHVHFDRFMADQVATVAAVHDHFDASFDAADAARIVEHLATRPQGRLGGHVHSFRDLGLDPAEQRARFSAYIDRFAVAPEAIDD